MDTARTKDAKFQVQKSLFGDILKERVPNQRGHTVKDHRRMRGSRRTQTCRILWGNQQLKPPVRYLLNT